MAAFEDSQLSGYMVSYGRDTAVEKLLSPQAFNMHSLN